MRLSNIKGIVIKEVPSGESDKILILLTHEAGKVSVIAKGAKRTNSRLLAGSQLLCYGEYSLFPSKQLSSVNNVNVIETFYPLRQDLVKLTYSTYLLELVEEVSLEGTRNENLLRLLLNTLFLLAHKERNTKEIVRIFELKVLALAGYMPVVHQCVHCGEQLTEAPLKFSVSEGGVLCKECITVDPYGYKISMATVVAMQYILGSDSKVLYKIELPSQVILELEKIMKSFIAYHLDRKFKSLEFLEVIDS